MGDKIIVEKIELIYNGTLFQIDYYNENKNYHGRMFIDSEKLFSIADVEPVQHCPCCHSQRKEESENGI